MEVGKFGNIFKSLSSHTYSFYQVVMQYFNPPQVIESAVQAYKRKPQY
jgi:hypothetical protein